MHFANAAGRLAVSSERAIRVDDGRVTVGSTQRDVPRFRRSRRARRRGAQPGREPRRFRRLLRSRATCSPERGALDFSFINTGRSTATAGTIALAGTRVRRFPLGTVNGKLVDAAGGTIAADLAIAGPAGSDARRRHDRARPPAARSTRCATGALAADVHGRPASISGRFLPAVGFTYPILGRATAAGHIAGVFPRLAIGGHATVADGLIGHFPVASAPKRRPASSATASRWTSASADLGFAHFTCRRAPWGSRRAGPAVAARPRLGAGPRARPRGACCRAERLDVGGALESDALISGSIAKPQLNAGFDLTQPRYGPLLVQRIVGNFESDLHSVKLDSAEFVLNHGSAVMAGSLPISLQPAGIGPPSAPLSITADARSVDLAALAPLLPGTGTKLGGTVDGHLALEGTVRAPRVLGTVSFSNGSYVSNLETSPIRDASAQLVFEGTSVALQALHAQVGAGSIDADGRLDLPFEGAPAQGYAIDDPGQRRPDQPAGVRRRHDRRNRTADQRRALPDAQRRPDAEQCHDPVRGDFPRGRRPGAKPARRRRRSISAFDLHADAKNIRIKSPIIDVGAAGSIALTGTLRAPRAAGEFTATRGGVFSTYQRLFRIQDATVTFDPNAGHRAEPRPARDRPRREPRPRPVAQRHRQRRHHGRGHRAGRRLHDQLFLRAVRTRRPQIVALLVDLPVLGSLNFGRSDPAGTLRGAPGESDALLPPGVTPYKTGVTPIQQEAFSLFNTQLTQRLLSPLENAFGGGARIHRSAVHARLRRARRLHRAATTLARSAPSTRRLVRSLAIRRAPSSDSRSRPDPATTISFTYFQQNGTPYYSNSIFGNTSTVEVTNGVQPLSDRQGFNFTITRTYPSKHFLTPQRRCMHRHKAISSKKL